MNRWAMVCVVLVGCGGQTFESPAQRYVIEPTDSDGAAASLMDGGVLTAPDASSSADAGAVMGTGGAANGHSGGNSGGAGASGAAGRPTTGGSAGDAAAGAGSDDAGTLDGAVPIDAGASCDLVELARDSWVATAFHSAFVQTTPDMAIDAVGATRWQSGYTQGSQPSEWFQIDLGASLHVARVVLQSAVAADQAVSLDVVLSEQTNDTGATPIVQAVSGGAAEFPIEVDATGRYLLLVQTGVSVSWWSINDVAVFGCVE